MENPTCCPKHAWGQRALLAFLMSTPVFVKRREHNYNMLPRYSSVKEC